MAMSLAVLIAMPVNFQLAAIADVAASAIAFRCGAGGCSGTFTAVSAGGGALDEPTGTRSTHYFL